MKRNACSLDAYIAKAEQWKRQLGAAQAREQKLKAQIRELEKENARLMEVGTKYRTQFEKMMGDPLTKLDELTEGRAS